ncbi:MAG: hypothetical protein ACI87E_004763 [Mariniblastus sp.]|jgi:hypothetical protein
MNQPPIQNRNPAALVGLIFAGIGVFGWLVVVAFLVGYPYSDVSEFEEFVRFVRNVVVLGFGGGISALFSIIGVIFSCIAVSRRQQQPNMARLGLVLSLVGIAAGVFVVLWRFIVFNSV